MLSAFPRSTLIRAFALASLLIVMPLLQAPVGAQSATSPGAPDAASEIGVPLGDEVHGELSATPPAIFSVGLSAGFPSYQTVALNASIQAQYVGLQLKGSWTAAGPYFGAQLRAYPPIPIPVPIFIGVGGGVYGSNLSYHFAVGAHVPLGKNLRFDLEGGVANVPVLAERGWAPHLAVGVSYAFPVDLAAGNSGDAMPEPVATGAAVTVASCSQPRDPDPNLISTAVERTVNEWLRSAQATFGSVYRDLCYSYRISSSTLTGAKAAVTVAYSGSVTEILTGAQHSATGSASATYSWNGCRWVGTGVEY